jgi:hypothetical protein
MSHAPTRYICTPKSRPDEHFPEIDTALGSKTLLAGVVAATGWATASALPIPTACVGEGESNVFDVWRALDSRRVAGSPGLEHRAGNEPHGGDIHLRQDDVEYWSRAAVAYYRPELPMGWQVQRLKFCSLC